jgi:ATP-dependent Clp protease protease subunit
VLKVNAKAGEIFIYDTIGADWFGGGITALSVINALEEIGPQTRATIRINSPGGVADEGIAIYNALKRHEGGVDTVVDSLAASAASIIALAGENRSTAKGGRWMIHRALTFAIGNAADMQKAVEVLTTYDESLVSIYKEYMDATDEEIMALLDAETWYTADAAIEAGLSTGKAEATEAEPMVASWFRNAPAALLNKPRAETKPSPYPVSRQRAKILK